MNRMSAIDAETLERGLPFDGSSIENWQPINESDMILKPDVPTAFLDPFTADSTVVVLCDVYDIYKMSYMLSVQEVLLKRL